MGRFLAFFMRGQRVKRALLVGIDRYENFGNLSGCVNDVTALTPLLKRNEDDSPNFSVQSLRTDEGEITRGSLLSALRLLLSPGADIALFYFAGHGTPAEGDVALTVSDGTSFTPGVRMTEVIELVQKSEVQELVLLLDCCFSGGAGAVPAVSAKLSFLRPGLSILAASRGDQVSGETLVGRGLFSTHLEGALEGGAADVLGNITMAGLYAYLSESFGAWQQRPTFKANIDRLQEIRKCAPSVPLPVLRRLMEWFPTPDSHYSLDPSFEPDAEPANAENEAVFSMLQKCRAAKLVEPVGEEHMYFAAMNSKGCRLTALGRHYRQMSLQDLL
ncbi:MULTISPECIES: caspase family protein [unclassified Streptomyces]|uniref:caspase family protein n=1 Tax=unclassified Streptomyces TaxID=2593676 RepID=UPI002DD83E40|nr:caspase family protein [Streptomyces sp. NBC_01750]WSA99307.1 caspase family protein [Streptomyces sp. NBC_01794]WSD36125.1 caspase family protein [Streptomyces sp. NBC_01750]